MSYPAPLLAEKLDREALDRMWDELKLAAEPKTPPPNPKPEPVEDGRDRMSEYLRTSAIALYCWMAERVEGTDK